MFQLSARDICANLVEQRRLDIAAADYGGGCRRSRERVAVEQPCRRGDGSARLGNGFGVFREEAYRLPDFLLAHR